MPYIKADDGRRVALRNGEPALTAGELNYQIFYYIKHYSKDYCVLDIDINVEKEIYKFIQNFLGSNPNYQKYNDITGVLIRCKKELVRKLNIPIEYLGIFDWILESFDDEIARYEDKKIKENGDVE